MLYTLTFRQAAGAWRRQKKEKRESLQNYQSLFGQQRESKKGSSDGSCSEGRSRRRREWRARKKVKHPNKLPVQEPVKWEFDTRQKEAEMVIIREKEEQRMARIRELSSEKVFFRDCFLC